MRRLKGAFFMVADGHELLCIVPLADKCASCSVACCSRCRGIAQVIGLCAHWRRLSAGDKLC